MLRPKKQPAGGVDPLPAAGCYAPGKHREPIDLRTWAENRAARAALPPVERPSHHVIQPGLTPLPALRKTEAHASVQRQLACQLTGMPLPDIHLDSVRDCPGVSVRDLATDWLVIYCYPGGSSRLDPQSYAEDGAEHSAYTRHYDTFNRRGTRVASLSSESRKRGIDTMFARNVDHRMLLDPSLLIADALGLPTDTAGRCRRYRRLTLVVWRGVIQHVFYPVPHADRNPAQVLAWMSMCGCEPGVLDAG